MIIAERLCVLESRPRYSPMRESVVLGPKSLNRGDAH
jgi:hypothetical protein